QEGDETGLMVADELATGALDRSSSSGALQGKLGVPQTRLRPYRDVRLAAPHTTDLVHALRVSAETAARSVAAQPLIEVAWTYPGPSRPGLRTTGGVAREIIDDSKSTLLVVGYTVTIDPSLSGLAAQTISAIARAAERGVVVTAVLHRDANRRALLQAWKSGTPETSFFTWPVADDDKAAIHAKLLIADRMDGLITSANLT